MSRPAPTNYVRKAQDAAARAVMAEALRRCHGNVTQAAQRLHMNRTQLYHTLHRYGLMNITPRGNAAWRALSDRDP